MAGAVVLDGDGGGTGDDAFVRTFRVDLGNLFVNGHFDCGIAGWDEVPPDTGQISHADADVNDSPDSGSVHVDDASGIGLAVEQCVSVTDLGAELLSSVRVDGVGLEVSQIDHGCEFFAGADCTGAPLGAASAPSSQITPTGGAWLRQVERFVMPGGTRSARCHFSATSQNGVPDVFFDRLVFASESLSVIFTDGFESGDTTAWSSTRP